MFYPVDSLKRGGRFYTCWVADSWPLQFATLTHRQLWSQDIRTICDDLLEVITNESGRPTHRFSLRLSSQLLRGLVRLYQKKVTVCLSELCMINATVFKNTNKKWTVHEVEVVEEVRKPLAALDVQVVTEVPDDEQRVEELIQNSSNVVANIQDITLKESAIPEILLPPNDNFGEEHPEQPLQLLQDRTLELMLQADGSAAQVSALTALDITDQSHDKTRPPHDPTMENIDEQDLTLFRKSTGAELGTEFEKDITEIPDIIPEIPYPDLPVPIPEKLVPSNPLPMKKLPREEVPEPSKQLPVSETAVEQVPVDIELEELEEGEPQAKRRRLKNKLIIDKKTQLSSNYLRSRIDNPMVELRCEPTLIFPIKDSSDDIISICVPAEMYLRRPCHGGHGVTCNIGFEISRLFMRNLGIVNVTPRAERETEALMQQSRRTQAFTTLERIEEVQEEIVPEPVQIQPIEIEQPSEVNVTKEIPTEPLVFEQIDLDIADMPTQKVKVLSQVPLQAQKRSIEQEIYVSPKRQRSGYVSFKESQQATVLSEEIKEISRRTKDSRLTGVTTAGIEAERDVNKENIPENISPAKDAEQVLSSMLQEAGLADIQTHPPIETEQVPSQGRRESKKTASERSETPLGSLDRTKVSLGDSDQTTDSKRFIREQWGTEGTMLKILKFTKAGLRPVTVENLITKGPVISGHKRVIAARCFSSILKLKQHGFIIIWKDPDTLQVRDISLGPKVTNSSEPF